jgi:hypothetical protein
MSIASLGRRPISRYRAPAAAARRPPPPLPPRWEGRERGVEMPPLSHFVFLSLLLHILAISLVGAPSGGNKEGRAMWGSLLVRLTPARPAAPPAPAAPAGTAADEALPAPLAFPRLLDRIAATEPKRDTTPPLKVPPPIEAQPRAPAPAEVTAPAAPAIAPSAVVPLPIPVSPSVRDAYRTLMDPPRILAAPAPPAPVVEVPRMQLAPATPQAERALIEAPRVLVAPAPAPPVESIAPRVVEPLPRPLDNALTQEILPPPGIPTALERAIPHLDPDTRIERDLPLKAETQPVPSPFRAPGPAAPRADDAANYDPTAPSLDPEAMRKRAAALPPVPEKKGKIEDILDKARKPDCRTAYQQLGLAAIIPLLANEIGEGTCRW